MKKDKKLIPRGYYCYNIAKGKRIMCLYWRLDLTLDRNKQENGYCEFLGKSDWDLNEERGELEWIQYDKEGKETGKSKTVPHEMTISLLWDQCKTPKCPKYDS